MTADNREVRISGDGREEIRGIAEGVSDGGGSDINYDDILLWNTMYDQWCMRPWRVWYRHPVPASPELRKKY